MAQKRLTKRAIDALPPATRKTGDLYYDTDLRGFGLRVAPSGRKVFFVNYGPRERRRRMTIGPYGVLTLEDARKRARVLLAQVIDGGDPLDDRDADRRVPTIEQWIDSYLVDVKRRKKSWKDDVRHLGWSKRRWRGRRLDALSTEDMRRAFAAYGEDHGPTQANRWLASIRACLAGAWRSDLIESNPAAKVRRNPEPDPRRRVLDDDEMKRLWTAVQDLDDPFGRAALELLVLTGARRSEVLRARWDDFDLEQRIWTIPSPKAGRPQRQPLSPAALDALRRVPRAGQYVVAGRDPDRPRYDIKRAWETARAAAKLDGVRLHDIRRTYGLDVAKSHGLHYASKLLRHSDVKITERHYAPLGFDDLLRVQDDVEQQRSNVVPFRRAGGSGG